VRVKIEFPGKKPLFQVQIPVRIGDINYGNHVGNDSVLSIIHDARMQALASMGVTELDIDGHGLIMADVMIAYRGEAFYGDVLEIALYATEVTDKTFDLLYHVRTTRNGKQIDIAHAKTGMVCMDYTTRKVVPCSESFKTWLLGF
jgi:acyl-CoA thioester hydrolase